MNEYINEHFLFNSTQLPSSVYNNMYTSLHKISHDTVLACGEWFENLNLPHQRENFKLFAKSLRSFLSQCFLKHWATMTCLTPRLSRLGWFGPSEVNCLA